MATLLATYSPMLEMCQWRLRQRVLTLVLLSTITAGCASSRTPPTSQDNHGMTRTVDVVFVVDGSKTMLAYFSDARNSLFRAIGELPPDTSFACIYAGAESRRQFGPLIRSTEAAREAYAFVNDLQPDMTAFADVGQAIRAANSLNAKTIWIVTNGGLAQSDKTARDALSAAAEGTGQVNTVLHFALHPDWRKFLFKLAQRGNGACVAEDGISVLRQPEGPGTFVDPSLSKSSFYQVRQ